MRPKPTFEQQVISFWSKVNKNGSIPVHCPELGQCWEWVMSCNKNGYGQFGFNSKCYLAHRVSWLFSFGDIPNKLSVLHKCDNPKCCNPKHLFLGTRKDNIKDMVAKGRQQKGEKQAYHKLTEINIYAIRERYAAGGIYQRELAVIYDVSQSGISRILQRNTWKHL